VPADWLAEGLTAFRLCHGIMPIIHVILQREVDNVVEFDNTRIHKA
jgi:hypothetical protein